MISTAVRYAVATRSREVFPSLKFATRQLEHYSELTLRMNNELFNRLKNCSFFKHGLDEFSGIWYDYVSQMKVQERPHIDNRHEDLFSDNFMTVEA